MLPLADFKSITVEPTPTEAPVSYLGTELAVAGGVLLVILLVFLLPRLRPKAKAAPEEWILIDGSNVMHWQDSTAVSSVFLCSKDENTLRTGASRAMFPAKVKKHTKVSSRQ